ncbi:tetratricopeptide repeat protein [Nocardiopsis lucentensis]|uniref:tetratricopeptide repeat protein n=1 Tax=Nocardiopsis lucentensis TaxID=53441 RepID=UPI00034C2976|nr:tetratricopeptide repeat protein [Nocardiopsis lucentensis]
MPNESDHYQSRELSDRLLRASSASPTVVLGQVLSGIGGVGKTQLAAHHARQLLHNGEIDLLVWAPASERMSIIHAYANAAHRVVAGQVDDAPERAAEQFLSWLQTTDKRWLVVLDNVDTPDVVRGLWPPTVTTPPGPHQGSPHKGMRRWRSVLGKGQQQNTSEPSPHGRVLVTSRRMDTAVASRGREFIEVDIYTPEEARAYLTHALADLPSPTSVAQLDQLSEELGYLPLALAHAAAYIRDRRTSITCTSYIELLRDRRRNVARVFPETESLPDDYPRTVAATWTVSIEHADTLAPRGLAQPMMRIISLLDPAGIPLRVLTCAPARDHLHHFWAKGEPLTEQDANEALSALERLNLLARTGQGDDALVTVHRLVQRTTREAPETRPDRDTAHTAADALVEVWSESAHASPYGQQLRANTTALVEHTEAWLWEDKGHEVLFRAGTSLGESGAGAQAVTYWQTMASTSEAYLGAHHPDTLTARGSLAFWRGVAGDAVGAVRALEELLGDRRRVLGSDHPDTLATRGSLSIWRGAVGDAVGAVHTLEELLADRHRVLGPDHPDTVITRVNLAHWRGKAGDPAGAVHVLEELLPDCQHVLGSDHPSTLATRGGLAHWLEAVGDTVGAARALEELLPDLSRVLGSNHPGTITTHVNLALCRGKTGDTVGAAYALEELLPDLARVLGPDHPSTLTTKESLAHWRGKAGLDGPR